MAVARIRGRATALGTFWLGPLVKLGASLTAVTVMSMVAVFGVPVGVGQMVREKESEPKKSAFGV